MSESVIVQVANHNNKQQFNLQYLSCPGDYFKLNMQMCSIAPHVAIWRCCICALTFQNIHSRVCDDMHSVFMFYAEKHNTCY